MKSIHNTLAFALCFAGIVYAGDPVSIALFGDMPYDTVSDTVLKYQHLIADVNANNVALSVHIGDIKGGNSVCADSVYSDNLGYFSTFISPVIYSVGDNEWTDCHRANNGAYDPLNRLALIRNTFFSQSYTLGMVPQELKRHPTYPEISRFISDRIMVVSLNMPGSNNNREQILDTQGTGSVANPFYLPCGTNPHPCGDDEYIARNAANIQWLTETLSFAATQPALQLVVIAFQANPFERFKEPTSSSNANTYVQSGYEDIMNTLRALVPPLVASGKKVIGVHGDTHTARVSTHVLRSNYPGCKPRVNPGDPCDPYKYLASEAGTEIPFTRIEVFGPQSGPNVMGNTHWIKVTLDKQTGDVTITPMLVTGNGTATLGADIPPL